MGIFSIVKGPAKPNLRPNIKYFKIIFEDRFFPAYKNLYKVGIHEKYLKKSFGFGKKKSAPIPIPKLDLGFGRTLFCIAIIEIAHRRPYIQWLIHETLPLFCRQKCVQHSLQMQCTQWGLTLCRKIAVFVHR